MEESTKKVVKIIEELGNSFLFMFSGFRKLLSLWANLEVIVSEQRRLLENEIQSLKAEVEELKEKIATPAKAQVPAQGTPLSASSILDRYQEEYNNKQ